MVRDLHPYPPKRPTADDWRRYQRAERRFERKTRRPSELRMSVVNSLTWIGVFVFCAAVWFLVVAAIASWA